MEETVPAETPIEAKGSSRNTTLYFFEVLACILIVFIHSHFPGAFGDLVMPGVARFGVPLFFVVAGFYLIKPGMSKEELRLKLKKRIIHVLILIALSAVIYFLVGIIQAKFGNNPEGIASYLQTTFSWKRILRLVLLNGPLMSLPTWFLLAMFFSYVILYVFAKQILEYKWIAYSFALLLPFWIIFRTIACLTNVSIGGYLLRDAQFYYNWLTNGLPFICLGIVLKRHEGFLKRIPVKWILTVYFASFVLMTLEFCLLMNYLDIYMSYYPSHVMNVIAIVTLAVQKPDLFSKSRLLNAKGNFTAYVYIFHPAVIGVAAFVLNKAGISENVIISWIRPLIVMLTSVAAALVFNWLVCLVKAKMASKKKQAV